jgi:hypothetical protein
MPMVIDRVEGNQLDATIINSEIECNIPSIQPNSSCYLEQIRIVKNNRLLQCSEIEKMELLGSERVLATWFGDAMLSGDTFILYSVIPYSECQPGSIRVRVTLKEDAVDVQPFAGVIVETTPKHIGGSCNQLITTQERVYQGPLKKSITIDSIDGLVSDIVLHAKKEWLDNVLQIEMVDCESNILVHSVPVCLFAREEDRVKIALTKGGLQTGGGLYIHPHKSYKINLVLSQEMDNAQLQVFFCFHQIYTLTLSLPRLVIE